MFPTLSFYSAFPVFANYESFLPSTLDCFWFFRIITQCLNIIKACFFNLYDAFFSQIIEKAREFQKNIYFCFINYAKAFDCVDHNKLW